MLWGKKDVKKVRLFRTPKRRVGEKKDVVGVSCLKDKSETVKVSLDEWKKIWKEHMEKLVNFENDWSDSIDASVVECVVCNESYENQENKWTLWGCYSIL